MEKVLAKYIPEEVSTHSRPKAAAVSILPPLSTDMFQHTAARRRLVCNFSVATSESWFQHTAARRRLQYQVRCSLLARLFQHTAARRRLCRSYAQIAKCICFNTQPPEGGCFDKGFLWPRGLCFNTQPPEGG